MTINTDDSNRDGRIDRQELHTLLLEVELEVCSAIPDVLAIAAQVNELMHLFDPDKSGDLDFLEFSRLIYSHPKLLGKNASLYSQITS